MSEKKTINLEEIIKNEWKKYPDNYINSTSVAGALLLQNAIKNCMKEACRQTLELAAENAVIEYDEGGATGFVDKESILDTINQIE